MTESLPEASVPLTAAAVTPPTELGQLKPFEAADVEYIHALEQRLASTPHAVQWQAAMGELMFNAEVCVAAQKMRAENKREGDVAVATTKLGFNRTFFGKAMKKLAQVLTQAQVENPQDSALRITNVYLRAANAKEFVANEVTLG